MPERAQYRRLVLMFDGTWNERSSLTNVARMFEAIDDYKPDIHDEVDPDDDAGAEPVQLVKYLKGVGTSWFGKILGGAVGYGLSDIIKEGYRWLSNNYRKGDEIFVFGFSRGAYSARSLVSLVHRCGGVLKPDMLNPDRLKPGAMERIVSDDVLTNAYTLYRGYVETTDGVNAVYEKQLREFGAKHCEHVTVKMLGVWDTVGALGIPDSTFTIKSQLLKPIVDRYPSLSNALADYIPWSRKHYGFHGQGLPCIVENAYHALAIDEHRADFAPTLWDERRPENKRVEQVWFVGSHCNVGGGATTSEDEDPDDLWQYAYVWMQNKAMKLGLRYSWTYGQGKANQNPAGSGNVALIQGRGKRRVSRTKPQDSYGQMARGIYAKLNPPVNRVVVGSKGASLHWSVKERLQQDRKYHPKSLEIPDGGPEKKYYTEIPDIPLPQGTCSCKKHIDLETSSARPPTKKKL